MNEELTVRIAFFSVVGLILTALALPPAIKERSWRRFFIAAGLAFAGVMLPLFMFLLSAFLIPEWKGGCPHGWLDCFHLGKLALTPLVLWATAALYAVDIFRVENRNRPWIVLGVLTGAMVSGGCLAIGIYIHDAHNHGMWLWLLVPAYVFAWYLFRAVQRIRESRISFPACLVTLTGSVPFWIAGVWWAKKTYLNLPDQAPSCFVVTAAGRGHEQIVGPFLEITRRGERRRVNRQLLTFWQLENSWRNRAPRSHAIFRRGYNRIGPVIARRMTSPWLADAAFVTLKPLEWLAQATVNPAKDENKPS